MIKSSVPAELSTEGTVGSPFKKHRASLPGLDLGAKKSLAGALLGAKERVGSEGHLPASLNEAVGGSAGAGVSGLETKMEEDEEEL